MKIIGSVMQSLCGVPLYIVLFGTGLFLTIRLGFVQFRYFNSMFACIRNSIKKTYGVSGFNALCAAVGGQLGAANLVGVAVALMAGGPGALFWMWMTAIFGMATSFTEVVLGILYREKGVDGIPVGGPSYYISKGLKNKTLAMMYSGVVVIGIGVFYALLQSNVITTTIVDAMPSVPRWTIAMFLVVMTGTIVFGGFKRVAKFATAIVPFFSMTYLVIAIVILITNASRIPSAFALIFESAFHPMAAGGGFVGYTFASSIRNGVARGLFSNDAGNGKASTLHAGATLKHPVNQGVLAMFAVFFDTMVVCTATALIILVTNTHTTNVPDALLPSTAVETLLGGVTPVFMLLLMFLLCFTTLVADVTVGSSSLEWMFPSKKKVIMIWRVISCGLVGLGAFISLDTIFVLIDFLTAMMVLINCYPLVKLHGKVIKVLEDYEKQKSLGIERPYWDFETDVDSI